MKTCLSPSPRICPKLRLCRWYFHKPALHNLCGIETTKIIITVSFAQTEVIPLDRICFVLIADEDVIQSTLDTLWIEWVACMAVTLVFGMDGKLIAPVNYQSSVKPDGVGYPPCSLYHCLYVYRSV